jgi:hypothetical protein
MDMFKTIGTVAAASLLAACGSGGGGGVDLRGQVVGSFIGNALVCADLNRNGLCDGGEPSTRTRDDGSFVLSGMAGNEDIVADVGPDATIADLGDGSDRRPVDRRFILRSIATLRSGNVVVSPLTTAASVDVEAGSPVDKAQARLAAAVGVDVGSVLGNYNNESDPVTRGLLQQYGRALENVLQDVVATAGDTDALRIAALRKSLMPPTTVGTVKYAWTQLGADDTPFSKLDITGIVPAAGSVPATPSLATNPAAAGNAIGAATFTTALQSPAASLVTGAGLVARAIVVPDASGNAACPTIRINGAESTMAVRAPAVTDVASRGDFYGSSRSVDFPVLTCEARLPAQISSVAVAGKPLKVASATAKLGRIVVIGDTGCRLKGPTAYVQAADGTTSGGDRLQDCTDTAAWAWPRIATVAASFAPDLVIHNGDMHYREGFPAGIEKLWGGAANAANGGSERDNATVQAKFASAGILDSITFGWRAWEEDFFKAAGPLLSAAPWALTRGNHELCDRAAQGWYRFLDPRNFPRAGAAYARSDEPEYDGPNAASNNYVRGRSFSVAKNCSQYTDPVAAVLGDLHLVLIDVGMMNDTPGLSSSMGATNGDHVRTARQLSAVSALAASRDPAKVTWLVGHKPFFAYAGGANVASGVPQSAQARTWQLQKAIAAGTESVATGNGTLPANTQMTHAGHIHGFQMVSQPASAGMPISVLMGTSGDNLEGLIEPNTGTPYAATGWANNISGGRWPWLDQAINGVLVAAANWVPGVGAPPQNFSSSPITGAGNAKTAVLNEFSFLVIDRDGADSAGAPNWKLQVYDVNRKLLRTCRTSGKTATCDG